MEALPIISHCSRRGEEKFRCGLMAGVENTKSTHAYAQLGDEESISTQLAVFCVDIFPNKFQ